MKINDYLQKHKNKDLIPTVVCNDGFTMSVQASGGHYCIPRIDNAPYYETVEVGYPNEVEELLLPFVERKKYEPTNAVYPYVHVNVVNAIIEKHGGFV